MISSEKSEQSSGAAPRREMEESSMTTSGTRRWWALGAVSLGVLAVGLDGTVLSVALPTLAKARHASESELQWFSSGYFLVLAAAMLPAGLLGDRYGHKKVLLVSPGLFGLRSLACAQLICRRPGCGPPGVRRHRRGRPGAHRALPTSHKREGGARSH